MKKILLILGLGTLLFASSCGDSLLDVKINKDNVLLSSVIKGLAKDCGYSIFYENGGEEARERYIGFLSVENKNADEMIDFLLKRHNLNYTLEDKVLTISKYATKTFKVDFLDSNRISSSSVDIDIGSGAATSGGGEDKSGSSGANISVEEKFNFWDSLESDIQNILSANMQTTDNRAETSRNSETTQRETTSGASNKVIINKKAGLVIVKGTYNQIESVGNYIDRLLDTLKKQVLIDVKIISVALNNDHKTGIDWSNLSMGFTSSGATTNSQKTASTSTVASTASAATGIATTAAGIPGTNSWIVDQSYFDANAFFSFLRTYGETRSLSSPKILTMNNQPSLVSVGKNINYSVQSSTATDATVAESSEPRSLFIGVLLDITPQIDDRGFVTLRINPSISNFVYGDDNERQTVARVLPPDTEARRISSVVRVRDGEVIILGGLISSTKANEETKVPLLGDIPFIGRLFKSNSVTDQITEIVFVLTPKIVTEDKKPSLKDLGFTIEEEGL